MKNMWLHKRRNLFIAIIIVIFFISFFAFWFSHSQKSKASSPKENEKTTSQKSQPNKASKNSETTVKKPVEQQIPESPPPTQACIAFTKQTAQQILGANAALSSVQSTVISETPDIATSACTYANGMTDASRKTVVLVAHLAKTPLGQSANGIEFGSGKPSDAQSIPEYGQAAFWDNTTSTLHVLKNNNHYEITRTSGSAPIPDSLEDIKIAANAIVPKL
jgi:hypothetical protein